MFLNAAPDYNFNPNPYDTTGIFAPVYTGQTGTGPLKALPVKKRAPVSTATVDSKPVTITAPPPLDFKTWLEGDVYVAGRNVPRKVLVGVAVSGALLLMLTGLGKKTVMIAAGK